MWYKKYVLIKNPPTRLKDILIVIAIVVVSLVFVWYIQDSSKPHPEIPQYNSNIP